MTNRLATAFSAILGKAATGPTTTVGSNGVALTSGWTYQGEASAKLNGHQKYVTFANVLTNTVIVAAGVRYFLNILAGAKWSVEPAKDEMGEELDGAADVAKLVEEAMHGMATPWYKVVRRTSMFRFMGFVVQEWTAKRNKKGQLIYADVGHRPQNSIERWDTDPTGKVIGMWQRLPGGQEVYLERDKVIYMVDDTLSDSPEGVGLLRHLVRSAERLKAYEELEEVAFETDLRGIPIARAPLEGIDAAKAAGKLPEGVTPKSLLAPLTRFVQNHIRNRKTGLLLDSAVYTTENDSETPSQTKKWDVELLQGSSTSQEAVAAAINRTVYDMARLIGVEHLLLGSDGTGSLALGEVKTSDFYMTVSSTLDEVVGTLDSDYLGPLIQLNGIPEELKPKFKVAGIEPKDVQAMADALQKIAQAGAPLDIADPVINELRDLMGLSRIPQEVQDKMELDAALKAAPPGQIPDPDNPGSYKPDPNYVPPVVAAPGAKVPPSGKPSAKAPPAPAPKKGA